MYGRIMSIQLVPCRPGPAVDASVQASNVGYPPTRDNAAGRENVVGLRVIVQRQAELLELVAALDAPGRFSRRLHRRQQQRDQDADDRNDHQQFHQGKRPFGRASRMDLPPHEQRHISMNASRTTSIVKRRNSSRSRTSISGGSAIALPSHRLGISRTTVDRLRMLVHNSTLAVTAGMDRLRHRAVGHHHPTIPSTEDQTMLRELHPLRWPLTENDSRLARDDPGRAAGHVRCRGPPTKKRFDDDDLTTISTTISRRTLTTISTKTSTKTKTSMRTKKRTKRTNSTMTEPED